MEGKHTNDNSGLFFYIKNLNSNEYWSATFEPCKTYGDGYKTKLNIDKPQFNRKDGNIETHTILQYHVRKILKFVK